MKTCGINWTKRDMARVILQALHNTDKAFPADHFKVDRMVRAFKKDHLQRKCEQAIEIIAKRNFGTAQ